MNIMKKIVKEIEEEIIDKQFCDNCNKEIEMVGACGYGAEYSLSDKWCNGCGGKVWVFCSGNCLREFVNKKCQVENKGANQ